MTNLATPAWWMAGGLRNVPGVLVAGERFAAQGGAAAMGRWAPDALAAEGVLARRSWPWTRWRFHLKAPWPW